MLFTTPTEWVALGITLIAGWLFGLASSSGGKKWKNALQEEEVSSAAYRHEAETALRNAEKRISQLEAERDVALANARTPEAVETNNTSSVIPLAAAAGAGAVAATLLHRDEQPPEPEPEPQPVETVTVDETPEAVHPVETVAPPPPVEEPVVTTDAPRETEVESSWIPPGPPLAPVPLAMGAPEPAPQPVPQPIAPDAPLAPAPAPGPAPVAVQEEVKAAEPVTAFPEPDSSPAAIPTVDPGTTDEVAPSAPVAPEPPIAQSEARPAHEWLPPHVRAEPEPEQNG